MRVNVCLAHVWNIFAQQRVLVNQQAVDMFGNKDFSDNSNINRGMVPGSVPLCPLMQWIQLDEPAAGEAIPNSVLVGS